MNKAMDSLRNEEMIWRELGNIKNNRQWWQSTRKTVTARMVDLNNCA
jgi:hypothetical protein